MSSPVIIDCRGHLLGRLSSIVAKQLLNGQQIVCVRTEEINISGSRTSRGARYCCRAVLLPRQRLRLCFVGLACAVRGVLRRGVAASVLSWPLSALLRVCHSPRQLFARKPLCCIASRLLTCNCVCTWLGTRVLWLWRRLLLADFRNKLKFFEKLRKHHNTNPKRGPFHFRAPSRILYHTVRGMIPHKTARGKAALARLKVRGVCTKQPPCWAARATARRLQRAHHPVLSRLTRGAGVRGCPPALRQEEAHGDPRGSARHPPEVRTSPLLPPRHRTSRRQLPCAHSAAVACVSACVQQLAHAHLLAVLFAVVLPLWHPRGRAHVPLLCRLPARCFAGPAASSRAWAAWRPRPAGSTST